MYDEDIDTDVPRVRFLTEPSWVNGRYRSLLWYPNTPRFWLQNPLC